MERQEILESILAGEIFLSAGFKLADYLVNYGPDSTEALGATLLASAVMGGVISYFITPKETNARDAYILGC